MTACIISTRTPSLPYPYMKIKGTGGRMFRETRVVLERKLGRPIRAGFVAMHLCHVKRCIEPEHLVEGTVRQNLLDSDVTRTGTEVTFPCGHPRIGSNSYYFLSRGRWRTAYCRTCQIRKTTGRSRQRVVGSKGFSLSLRREDEPA